MDHRLQLFKLKGELLTGVLSLAIAHLVPLTTDTRSFSSNLVPLVPITLIGRFLFSSIFVHEGIEAVVVRPCKALSTVQTTL